MPEYVARNVTVIDFSNPQNLHVPEIYHIPLSVIKLKHTTIDIGSNCYASREVDKNGNACNTIKNNQDIRVIRVSLASLNETRIPSIKKLIEYIAYRAVSASQRSLESWMKWVLRFLRFYWAQLDLDYAHLENRAHYEEAARRYSSMVNANNKISSAHKHQLTNAVFHFAEFVYDEELSAFDYDIIQNPEQNRGVTRPLLPEDQELALALRSSIFEGVTDLLVHKKMFPFPLTIPKACNELNDTLWLGYAPWAGPSPFPRAKDFEKRQPKEWFNREIGALVTKEQWFERFDHKSSKRANDSWLDIQRNLNANNLENSKLKHVLAEYAGLCFLDLLLSITGMNQQPALDLPWLGGFFVQKAKQGTKTITLVKLEDQSELAQKEDPSVHLRSLKNRKGYQPVEVTIGNRFLPQFKRYLQLREYYLNGRTDARLFPFSRKLLEHRRHSLQAKFPEVQKLGAHKARAGVSDSILTSTNDPYVVSEILQNAPQTVIRHYAAGTQKAHIQGLGGFFNALGNQIKVTRLATKNEIDTAVGSCDNGGTHPDALSDSPIEPNCTQQEGCFFCRHYCVHADEIDVRKLVSVLYYINKGATRAHDVDFYNDLFSLVTARIKDLLEQIEAISAQKKALVSRIKEEVFAEEALDEYWLSKLNRLEMIVGER